MGGRGLSRDERLSLMLAPLQPPELSDIPTSLQTGVSHPVTLLLAHGAQKARQNSGMCYNNWESQAYKSSISKDNHLIKPSNHQLKNPIFLVACSSKINTLKQTRAKAWVINQGSLQSRKIALIGLRFQPALAILRPRNPQGESRLNSFRSMQRERGVGSG